VSDINCSKLLFMSRFQVVVVSVPFFFCRDEYDNGIEYGIVFVAVLNAEQKQPRRSAATGDYNYFKQEP